MLMKLSVLPVKEGWTVHAHYVNGKGKDERITTDVYACESIPSVMRSVRGLLNKMESPADASTNQTSD